MAQWRRIVGTIALVTMVTAVLPWKAIAQTEPDNDVDAYDQFTCSDVSEDEMAATRDDAVPNPFGPIDQNDSSSRNAGNDPDAFSPFPNGSFQLPFELDFGGGQSGGGGGGGGQQTFSFVPTYTSDEDKNVNDSFYPEPQITLQIAPPTAVQGEDVTATVQYDSFSSPHVQGQDFYTVAFVDGIFLNGYMAGGSTEALEQMRVQPADPARPDCGVFSRETQSDSDGDGMDDAWEIRYDLNPNDAGDAGQDPDNDGFVADTYKNLLGEVVQPAPAIANGELGDGRLTNYEEFVLDTDPRVPDTDGDGFADEADAVGFGQTIVRFPATKALGEPAYNLHVIAVGITEKLNEDGAQLVKIDSTVRQVQTGTREKLEVELALVTGAAPGETLVVAAEPSGSEQLDLLNTYRWSVGGTLVTASSGQGRRTLEYPIEAGTPVGTNLDISVDVINFETGQLARGALTVVVGDIVLLDFDPQAVEMGGSVPINAQLTSTEPVDDFLFNWSLDERLIAEASSVGAQEFVAPVTARASGEHVVRVDVYRVSDSALLGSARGTLRVLAPAVTLTLTPELPALGQQVVARADADHFGSTTLQYAFTLDGAVIDATGPITTLPALTQGQHTLAVTVRSIEPPSESATAQITFAVSGSQVSLIGPTSPTTPGGAGQGGTPLASLMSRSSGPVVGVAAALGLGAVLFLLVRFNRGKVANTMQHRVLAHNSAQNS